MTAQREDTIVWKKKHYVLLSIFTPAPGNETKGTTTAPFHPLEYSMIPVMMNTGCYRGYFCTYNVLRNKLYVDTVDLRTKDKKRPQINSVKPTSTDGGYTKQFNKLGLALPYTGKLRIARDLIANRFRNMGFQETTSYRSIIDLDFKDGQLVDIDDLSRVVSVLRDAQAITDDYTKNNWMTYEWHAKFFENHGLVDDNDIDDMFEQHLRRLEPQALFSLLHQVICRKREPIWFVINYNDYYERNHYYEHTFKHLKFIGLPQSVLDYLSKSVSKNFTEKQVVVSFMNAILEKQGKKFWGENMRVIIAKQFKAENGDRKLKTEMRKKLANTTLHSWGCNFGV
jgi:hypothetical protein